jgi:hypothetical protein
MEALVNGLAFPNVRASDPRNDGVLNLTLRDSGHLGVTEELRAKGPDRLFGISLGVTHEQLYVKPQRWLLLLELPEGRNMPPSPTT